MQQSSQSQIRARKFFRVQSKTSKQSSSKSSQSQSSQQGLPSFQALRQPFNDITSQICNTRGTTRLSSIQEVDSASQLQDRKPKRLVKRDHKDTDDKQISQKQMHRESMLRTAAQNHLHLSGSIKSEEQLIDQIAAIISHQEKHFQASVSIKHADDQGIWQDLVKELQALCGQNKSNLMTLEIGCRFMALGMKLYMKNCISSPYVLVYTGFQLAQKLHEEKLVHTSRFMSQSWGNSWQKCERDITQCEQFMFQNISITKLLNQPTTIGLINLIFGGYPVTQDSHFNQKNVINQCQDLQLAEQTAMLICINSQIHALTFCQLAATIQALMCIKIASKIISSNSSITKNSNQLSQVINQLLDKRLLFMIDISKDLKLKLKSIESQVCQSFLSNLDKLTQQFQSKLSLNTRKKLVNLVMFNQEQKHILQQTDEDDDEYIPIKNTH